MHKAKLFTMAAALPLSGLVGAAVAENRKSARVVTTLNGEATVTHATVPQPVALRVREDVFVRDQIRTEQRSLVRALLGGKALTVRELSVPTVMEEAGRVTVNLESGKIGVAVVNAPGRDHRDPVTKCRRGGTRHGLRRGSRPGTGRARSDRSRHHDPCSPAARRP
jgi:hypothetical protein